MGLATKLAYQLEVQVTQRKSTAESTINILEKLLKKYSDLRTLEAISILKFMINQIISSEEKDLIINLGLGVRKNNDIDLSKEGKALKSDLNLNIGTLKRIKNYFYDRF